MNVASLAILPVSVGCVELLEGAEVAVLPGSGGAQVMVEGATVLVDAPLVVAVRLREVAAIAGHHIVGEMSHFMLMGMALGNVAGAGAGAGAERSKSSLDHGWLCHEFLVCLELVQLCNWVDTLTFVSRGFG